MSRQGGRRQLPLPHSLIACFADALLQVQLQLRATAAALQLAREVEQRW